VRYLSAPEIESHEERMLPADFGKAYAPRGTVTIPDSARLHLTGIDFVDLEGRTLAIEPDTASWSFLTRREAALLQSLEQGRSFAWLAGAWPTDARDTAQEFAGRLFRRGLISVEGTTSVDPGIFHDSPNTREGHLVELLLTEKCNLACPYCLAGAKQSMPQMSAEVAHRSVELAFRMREASSLTFEFAGGEPFVRFDLMKELVEDIRERARSDGRSVYLCVQTNGTLLTQERVDWLAEHQVSVGLSLDGDAELQNRSRPQVNGGESFSKMLRGLDLLQRRGVDLGVLVVLNRGNVESPARLIDFLVENGIRRVKINPIAYLGTGRETWSEFGLNQGEVIAFFQDFVKCVSATGVDLVEANLQDMLVHLLSKRRPSRCLRGHCGAGETFQSVTSDGGIYPCGRATQSPGLRIANVSDPLGSLSEPGRTNLRVQQIRERRPKTLEGCVVCSYRELCQAGCSAQAWERYGTVLHRTPECDFFKTMYPFMMRWLCFEPAAIDVFANGGYFGPRGRELALVQREFLPD
jgi:uncharacterized protein